MPLIKKTEINLLQPELLPAKALVTLNRVVFVWLLLLVAMMSWHQYATYQLAQAKQTQQTLHLDNKNKTQLIKELQQEIKLRKKDPALEAKLATLQVIMRNKQLLHARLTDPEQTYVAGFANAMTELAQHHHKDISLQQVIISGEHLQFSGVARKPAAIPKWLSGFEQSDVLAGKQFEHFHIYENEHKLTEFAIGSSLSSLVKGDK